MDVTLIERLSNAASELEGAREYLGSDVTQALWTKLLNLQNDIEAIIRDEAAS